MDAEQIKAKYEPAILGVMERWGCELADIGHEVSDIVDMADEEYVWGMDVDGKVGVTLTLLESEVCEGSDEGFNWSVEATGDGGKIIGHYVPYNFTPDVWTDDPEELERRWSMVTENTDIVEAIERGLV